MLSGRDLCDELVARPEESYRLCCVVVCDLETSRMGAPYIYIYIYDISRLRVKPFNVKVEDVYNCLCKALVNTQILRQTVGCHWTTCHSAAVQAFFVGV